MKNVLILVTVLLLILVIGFVYVVNDITGPCYEDMSCWNCETMGNQICGEGYINNPTLGIDSPWEDYLPYPIADFMYWYIDTFVKESK